MLLHALVAWLAISSPSASPEPVAAFKALKLAHPALFVAPDLPEMGIDKLPGLPLGVPGEARCLTVAGDPLGEGVYLPLAWSDAIHLQLERGSVYPVKTQARLNELGDLALVALDAQGNAVRADSAVDVAQARLAAAPGFWDYLPVTAITAAIALGVGFAAGVALSK